MAKPVTSTFGKFVVLLGDGASPENFAAPCGFTDKSLELKATTSDQDIPDCDNPDLPAWTERGVKSQSATVTGQGVLALESHAVWRNWFLGGAQKNVRVQSLQTLANGGGYYQGPAVLTSFKLDASLGDRVKQSVNIESADAWTWTDATS